MNTVLSNYYIGREKKGLLINTTNLCIFITLVCNLGILYGNPYKNNLVVSLSTRILIVTIIVFAVIMALNLLRTGSGRTDKKTAITILLFAVAIILPLLSGLTSIVKHYVSILCFLLVPSYFLIFSHRSIDYKQKKIIYYFNLIYVVLFFILANSKYAYIVYTVWATSTSDVLTLGYNNPNETGMMLLIPLMILEIAFIDSTKRFERILFGVASIYMMYLLVKNDSRTCLILGFIFTIALIFRKRVKITRKTINTIILIPLFIMIIQAIISTDILNSIQILNEAVGPARKLIILSFFSNTPLLNYIWGSFSSYAGSNLHNSYLTIIAMYGLIGLVVYLLFLKEHLINFVIRCKSDGSIVNHLAIIAIIIVILHGCSEAAYIVSGSVYGGLVGMLIMLASTKSNEEIV